MNISLNGNPLDLQAETSLLTLIEIKGLKAERVVIEYNYNILSKEDWGNTIIKENDIVEVLNFVGGG